jgi:predicted dehydrogenase
MIQVALVGAGGWGKNLARNYSQIPGCALAYVCDLDPARLEELHRQLPGTRVTTRFADLLEDPAVQAIAVATTAAKQHGLCKAALRAGKDVFVEKPFVLTVADAEELVEIAEQEGRILMVGYLLKYHPAIGRLKELIDAGALGDVHYVHTQRLNLGVIRKDANALWYFAPHDIAVSLYLVGKEPTEVAASGQSFVQPGIEDVVFTSLKFGTTAMAHVHVSWLEFHKTRKITVVGSAKTAVFDDRQIVQKLTLYDKSAAHGGSYASFAEDITSRVGDISIPHLEMDEPLRVECQHFVDCIRERRRPLSDGKEGVRVVRILEAAQRSLETGGMPIHLSR